MPGTAAHDQYIFKMIIKKIVPFLGLLFIAYGCKTAASYSPKTTVTAFIEAARQGDLVKVKQYITRSDVSMLEMGESFMAKLDPEGAKGVKDKMLKEFKAKAADAQIDILDEKIDGENATVNVAFHFKGRSETKPFSLVKEEGKWKIALLSTGMKNSGANEQEIRESFKKINIDSVKDLIEKGKPATGEN